MAIQSVAMFHMRGRDREGNRQRERRRERESERGGGGREITLSLHTYVLSTSLHASSKVIKALKAETLGTRLRENLAR